MNARNQNEKKFANWFDLPNGDRHYWYDIYGRHGWKARYNKIVDSEENMIRFYQEIFDDLVNFVKFIKNTLTILVIKY